ncbi:MAG: rRNA maturation RNase YbeY [Elusimicrobiota bacterium]|jgi:probable rRNA maturation factor
MNVLIFGKSPLAAAGERALIRAANAALGPSAKKRGELCIILCTDAQIRKVNSRFLRHDRITDVISFRYPEQKEGSWPSVPAKKEVPPFGDIYIGLGAARKQSKQLGHDLLQELIILVLHGTLHLMGYDDQRPADTRRMFTKQAHLLARLCGQNRKPAPAKKTRRA